jgi:thioredoxin reductase (NADPH)
MAPEEGVLAPESVRRLGAAGVQVVSDRPRRVRLEPGQRGLLEMDDGSTRSFDVIYPMTGGEPHIQLAAMLGAHRTGDGRLVVDIRQQTTVPGLYAAGDVVASLGQVAVAVAEGAVAATAIHRSLAPNFR